MSIDSLSNLVIPILTVVAIWLLNREEGHPWKKYGPPLGLLAQPFWFITSYIHGQWGLFVLAMIMVVTYVDGCMVYWTKSKKTSADLAKWLVGRFTNKVEDLDFM